MSTHEIGIGCAFLYLLLSPPLVKRVPHAPPLPNRSRSSIESLPVIPLIPLLLLPLITQLLHSIFQPSLTKSPSACPLSLVIVTRPARHRQAMPTLQCRIVHRSSAARRRLPHWNNSHHHIKRHIPPSHPLSSPDTYHPSSADRSFPCTIRRAMTSYVLLERSCSTASRQAETE